MGTKYKYDSNMDKECIEICDALNNLTGVYTTESCCGHCKDKFMIFLNCNNEYSLSVIARVFDKRYIGTSQLWKVELISKDNGGYSYYIHSDNKYSSYELMTNDINILIRNIKHWSGERYKSYFMNTAD